MEMDFSKKTLLLSLLFTAFLLQSTACSAFTETINAQISENGSAELTHSVSIELEEIISLALYSESPENISVSCNECRYEIEGKQIDLSDLNETTKVEINYSTDSLTEKEGEKWGISMEYFPYTEEITMVFPENAKITFSDPAASIYFDGKNMIVSWKKRNLTAGKKIASVNYSFEAGKKENPFPLTEFIALLLAAAVIAVIFIKRNAIISMLNNSPKANCSKEQEELLKTISSKEKEIVLNAMQEEGITQKKLMQKSSIPKATLSRTLWNLQEKNFIKIAEDGYTNRIYLSDWFKGKK